MPSTRYAWIAVAALLLAACANQMEPAQRSISDIEAALSTAASEAAKYVPDQLTDVRRELGDLKATFDRQDYAGVLKAAPAVMERAQGLESSAAAKKAELTQALDEAVVRSRRSIAGIHDDHPEPHRVPGQEIEQADGGRDRSRCGPRQPLRGLVGVVQGPGSVRHREFGRSGDHGQEPRDQSRRLAGTLKIELKEPAP